QAEDSIRDRNVTGVQTCALPILGVKVCRPLSSYADAGSTVSMFLMPRPRMMTATIIRIMLDAPSISRNFSDIVYTSVLVKVPVEIGRASCRERMKMWEIADNRAR